MSELTEHRPGEPAPRDGHYEALNIFGNPIGRTVEAKGGEPLPALPHKFTWRLTARAGC
jgi:hypothetical protein